jgi:acetylornithine/succinyldiaminopimelate/putrescine aminotransferase
MLNFAAMNQRELFLRHVAQTSEAPLAIEIVKAKDSCMWDSAGKKYIDLISGISVCNIGHSNDQVIEAVKKQAEQYMHIMVYGELIESPQVKYAAALVSYLPPQLNSVYFTNSGTEATEGAMKLAKRVTGRSKMMAFHDSYHGSTQGALSAMGSECWRNAFRPLLPGIVHHAYNSDEALDAINDELACIILESVQAERGVMAASLEWMQALRKKCNEHGVLLMLDEIQTGFGRTSKLFAFEHYGIVPDILLLGKALGGGMPLGAFIANRSIMSLLSSNPILGHITTFGGHPVACAAGNAAFEFLINQNLIRDIDRKQKIFVDYIKHPLIRNIRSMGFMMALEFDSYETNKRVIDTCIEMGVFTDWFLFASHCMRISPPLIITDDEIKEACIIVRLACDKVSRM